MTQRVTDETAREIVASGLKHLSMVAQCDLAADLLDARSEVEYWKGLSRDAITLQGDAAGKLTVARLELVYVQGEYEKQLMAQQAEIAALRTKLDKVCEAGEDAIGYAHQHDSLGRITFIDRSQPIAQYSDDGPDAWPARLHAAIAAALEGGGE